MFAALIGWFPGYNARRRNHRNADRVNFASWSLIFVSVAITITGYLDGFVAPALLGIWVAITTWSYGRTPPLPKALRSAAFEVVAKPETTAAPAAILEALPVANSVAGL
jgi:hypothetical protein